MLLYLLGAINIFISPVKSPLVSVADLIFWCVFQQGRTLWNCKLPSKAKRLSLGFHLVGRSCGLLWGLRWFKSTPAISLFQRSSAFWLERPCAKKSKVFYICFKSRLNACQPLAFMNLEKISAPYISKALLKPGLDGEFDCGKYEICSKLLSVTNYRVHCHSSLISNCQQAYPTKITWQHLSHLINMLSL